MMGYTAVTQNGFSTYRYANHQSTATKKKKIMIGIRAPQNTNFGKPLWEQVHAEAENAFRNNQFEKAYTQYKFILDNFAEYFVINELLYSCGIAASKIKKYELALRYFAQCFKLHPSEEVLNNIQLVRKCLED